MIDNGARGSIDLGSTRAPQSTAMTVPMLAVRRYLAPAVTVGTAGILGLSGVAFGLPFLFRPDEDVMVGRSVRMALEGTLDPSFYVYPPVAFDLFAGVERLLPLLPAGRLGPATEVDPTGEYLLGRLVSALAFVAAVLLTQSAARRLYGVPAGLIAGLVLAVAPLAVREAHFATVDSVQMLLVAGTVWATVRMDGDRSAFEAGFLCGLAGATKYIGGLAIVLPLLVALIGGEARLRRAGLVLTGSAVGFAMPFLPLLDHLGDYVGGLHFLAGRSAGSYGGSIGLVVDLTQSLPFGMGFGTFGLAIFGLGVALVRRTPHDLGLVAMTGTILAALSPTQETFFRYVLPALPALAVLAGGTIRALPATLSLPGRAAFGGLVLLLAAPSLLAAVTQDRMLEQTDTRAQAAAWLLAHAPRGASVGFASYWGEPFYGSRDVPRNPRHPLYTTTDPLPDTFQQGLYTTRFVTKPTLDACYSIYESGPPDQGPLPRLPRPAAVTFLPFHGPLPAGAVYDRLDSFYVPLWGFAGFDRPGPAIAIVETC